ncbi:MAG TPA: DUF4148 domain-containing protein [Noviherbaspirillum sp.]|uniref:DUF4148 domain-containing protein n=1 Tax=Noviherbaspirillum sp. TaxID=1926288 RepID=UPI002F952A76
MNVKNLIAVVAVLAAGSAFADDTYPYVDQSRFVGSKTRAEVQAELSGAPAIASRQTEYVEFASAGNASAGKTRAEVQAELERDYAAGRYAATAAPEYVEFTRVASTRSRDDVRREALQAARGATAKDTSSGS